VGRVSAKSASPIGLSAAQVSGTSIAHASGAAMAAKTGKKARRGSAALEHLARTATVLSGSSGAFALAAGIVVVWLVSGPLFGFSDTWQLVINTGTTIVTFLMVFLIQRSQNKDAAAVQLKLNEIVAALDGASNRLIGVEDLSEQELATLHKYYCQLARLAKEESDLTLSHSIEEAEENAVKKTHRRRRAR
jgi:low affinity Fe/Cu permease